jgi:hypothetical protein
VQTPIQLAPAPPGPVHGGLPPLGDGPVFLRVMTLLRHLLQTPFDRPTERGTSLHEHLISEGEIPPAPGAKGFGGKASKGSATAEDVRPPVWLGQDYQLQRQPAAPGVSKGWQRGHWRALSPLAGTAAGPLEWVEPVLVG